MIPTQSRATCVHFGVVRFDNWSNSSSPANKQKSFDWCSAHVPKGFTIKLCRWTFVSMFKIAVMLFFLVLELPRQTNGDVFFGSSMPFFSCACKVANIVMLASHLENVRSLCFSASYLGEVLLKLSVAPNPTRFLVLVDSFLIRLAKQKEFPIFYFDMLKFIEKQSP